MISYKLNTSRTFSMHQKHCKCCVQVQVGLLDVEVSCDFHWWENFDINRTSSGSSRSAARCVLPPFIMLLHPNHTRCHVIYRISVVFNWWFTLQFTSTAVVMSFSSGHKALSVAFLSFSETQLTESLLFRSKWCCCVTSLSLEPGPGLCQ